MCDLPEVVPPEFNVLQKHLAHNYTSDLDLFLQNNKFDYFEPLKEEKSSFFGSSKKITNFKAIIADKLTSEDLDQLHIYHKYLSSIYNYNIGFSDISL